jgi:GAF domain-containing protein
MSRRVSAALPPPAAGADSPDAAIRAMRAASSVFEGAPDRETVIERASRTLARDPGDMCVISLAAHTSDSLTPVSVAHRRRDTARDLQRLVHHHAAAEPPTTDAFSREVQSTGQPLKMPVGSSRVLHLWLPPAYWSYVDEQGVSGVLAAGLKRRGHVFGTLLLLREGDRGAFGESDQAYVTALAERLAVAL